jgi:hypothetical protein
MATFVYNGEEPAIFPTIAVTVNPGDSFDAPDDFVAENVTIAKGKKASAPETAPATIEEAPAEPEAEPAPAQEGN